MWCPKCGSFTTKVIGTQNKKSNETMRFRFCLSCEYSFLSIEFFKNYENLKKYTNKQK